MALANILQGDVGMLELRRSVEQNWERLRFVEWDMPKYFKTSIANSSPYLPRYCKVNGFMLANHTSVRKVRARFRDNSDLHRCYLRYPDSSPSYGLAKLSFNNLLNLWGRTRLRWSSKNPKPQLNTLLTCIRITVKLLLS